MAESSGWSPAKLATELAAFNSLPRAVPAA